MSMTASKAPGVFPTGPARRFSVANTIDGYEVIDQDGRPVSGSYDFANEPLEKAADLNEAVAAGPDALRLALGGLYQDDLDDEDYFMHEDGPA